MTDDHQFARRLRQTREALGLTEEQAARQAGRSVKTWRKYETLGTGRVVVPLIRLAKRHKGQINFDWLLGLLN